MDLFLSISLLFLDISIFVAGGFIWFAIFHFENLRIFGMGGSSEMFILDNFWIRKDYLIDVISIILFDDMIVFSRIIILKFLE